MIGVPFLSKSQPGDLLCVPWCQGAQEFLEILVLPKGKEMEMKNGWRKWK